MVYVSACSMDVCGHMTIQHADTIECIKRNRQTGTWWAICRWTGGENEATSTIQGYFSFRFRDGGQKQVLYITCRQQVVNQSIHVCDYSPHSTFILSITILEPSLSLFAFGPNGLIFFSSIKLYFYSNNLQCNVLTQCHFENTCFNLCTFLYPMILYICFNVFEFLI